MKNTLKEIQKYICKLNVDVTIEVFMYNPYWDNYYSDCDELEDDNEFADFSFYPYNPFDEPPKQVTLTFYEWLKEMVIFNENFEIPKYEVPESEFFSYTITWNNTSTRIAKDKVIPFLNSKFPEQYKNLIRSEKLDKILNDFD